jgi:hypothetical protein
MENVIAPVPDILAFTLRALALRTEQFREVATDLDSASRPPDLIRTRYD